MTPLPNDYTRNYIINVVLVAVFFLAAICNVIVPFGGAFFGLSDVQWHYVLAFSAVITTLNTAFNHTPPVTMWPARAKTMLSDQAKKVAAL